ncbi:MAG: FAD-binding protein [Ruminococcus sp.]|nr:FAD-binding protein [Ruminococcus sp.]MCM1381963.1 FAD-binding protein [Muribaculaceae bacterium]MCM1479837.1 FAD-binding protein [Muribaculaceae bacterium]
MTNFDIAIVGGGPAGATLARLLDGRFSVLLIDGKTPSEESFRKVCGGLLSPDAQKAFAEFDLTLPKDIMVDPQIFSVRTIDLNTRTERHYQRFYMNLDRHKFDLWLESLVPERVTRFVGKCVKISRNEEMYILNCRSEGGAEEKFSAKYIVGADGAGSAVRKFLYPGKKIRRYTAIQQWFPESHAKPFYSCIFDPVTSDCCSWSISKDSFFIFGGAFAPEGCRKAFEEQKRRLAEYGFKFGEPLKTEACIVLRPKSPFDVCAGRDGAFLIGEAAGLISPSSLEGISFAVNSARLLAEVLNSGVANPCGKYCTKILPLKIKILVKVLKCPFMYNPTLRKIVMKSGISSITIQKNNDKNL